MKFLLERIEPEYQPVEAGNLYHAKGPGPTYWLVVAVTDKGGAHMLGLNRDGEIVSTTTYGAHALRDRKLIGRCHEISEFTATIQGIDE